MLPKYLAVLLFLLGAPQVLAQATTYPNRPIRFVVGNPPGGGQDTIARMIGARLGEGFAVPVVVDNRPGAAGNVAAELVARAPADGHTLLMIGFANTANVGLYKKLPFDLLKDFSSIALVAESTNFLITPATSRFVTLKDLISHAKSAPGKLNYGSGGNGTVSHLGAELFKRMAGINVVHIPYRGGGPSMAALVAAQIDLLIANPLNALPQIKAGRAKALAVTSRKRSSAAPNIPTVDEAALTGFEVISWWGVVAPRNLPTPIVLKLNAAITQSLDYVEIKRRFEAEGIEPVAADPKALTKLMHEETAKWTKVIREAGIEAD